MARNKTTHRKDDKKTSAKKNCKANKRGKKYSDKVTESTVGLDSTGRDNDPNWYFLDRNVADQASSFSFDEYLGIYSNFHYQQAKGTVLNKRNIVIDVPAICAIACNPCPGDTSQVQTGINVASLKNYSTLSSMNAKTTQYAPQDLTTLTLALGEVVSVLEHMRRAFGVAFLMNQRNRAVPRKLLEMMGFEPEDFLTNLAGHRLAFNSLITAFNKIPFVDNVSYTFKCADMYQKVYADSDSTMAQIVFMRPYSTWTLDETASDQGSVLATTPLPQDKTGTWER